MWFVHVCASIVICDLISKVRTVDDTDRGVDGLVWVKEIDDGPVKRSLEPLPEYLHVQFDIDEQPIHLRLRRSHVNINTPITFDDDDQDDTSKEKKNEIPDLENVGLYQDLRNSGVMSVTVETDEQGLHQRNLKGSFSTYKARYTIGPADDIAVDIETLVEKKMLGHDPEGTPHRVRKLTRELGKTAPNILLEMLRQGLLDGEPGQEDYILRQEAAYSLSDEEDTSQSSAKNRTHVHIIKPYFVEVRFVLDHTVWEYFMKENNNNKAAALKAIKYHFSHQMNGIDMAYRTIEGSEWGFTISIWLKEYYISKSSKTSTWTVEALNYKGNKNAVNSTEVLRSLGEWSHTGGRGWGNPDHTMLWTRYDLNGDSVVGRAYVNAICSYNAAVSVVEHRDFHDWSTAAHELGHNLGALHDTEERGCPGKDAFIMHAGGGRIDKSTHLNAYKFSDCSITYFKDSLTGDDGYPKVCLTNRVCTEETYNLGKLPGQVYNRDAQCQTMFGEHFKFCDSIYRGNYEQVCLTLRCGRSISCTWLAGVLTTLEGTDCDAPGQGLKWCRQGRCVSKKDNPAPTADNNPGCVESKLPNNVPVGCEDSYSALSCKRYVNELPYYCFSKVKVKCCASCHRSGLVKPTFLITPTSPWGPWAKWSSCTESCGGGSQQRTRTCKKGSCQGQGSQQRPCNQQACPQTPNSVVCQDKYKNCKALTSFCDTPKYSIWIGQNCNKTCNKCSVGLEWAPWTKWSSCSVTCGTGMRSRSRVCLKADKCSGSTKQTESCKASSCRVDGGWSAWKPWTACSATCGTGIRKKTRACDNPKPTSGGKPCDGASTEIDMCQEKECLVPVNGGWSHWSPWSSCTVTCGTGATRRLRVCDNPAPKYGGKTCTGSSAVTKSCKQAACPGGVGCVDKNDHCKYLLEFCDSSKYRNWMTENCRKSCKKCKGVAECSDSYKSCATWAAKDFCTAEYFSEFMKKNCAKSCDAC